MPGEGVHGPSTRVSGAGLSDSDDRYLTAGQVAERLHVSTKTVHRWAEQGMLACTYTLGGHRRFSLRDVESAIAQFEERRDAGHSGGNDTGEDDHASGVGH